MTRRFRRVIFFIFVCFFIAASVIVVFFAQGYRIDFKSLTFVKTGGIFVETSINDAKIYVDDKYIESTNGILNHNTLIEGLTPKAYNVFIYKENYYPWNKVVEVKSGTVVGLNNVILFPLIPEKSKIIDLPVQTISEFFVEKNTVKIKNNNVKTATVYNLNDGKLLSKEKFIMATSVKEFISPDENKKLEVIGDQLWLAYLKDMNKDPIKKAGDKELIATYETPVKFFNWLNDSEHIIWFADGALN
ncbi:MAG TPA: PEGA domain-containing protein, partial [Candidatus Paceibacterota bacterium]